MRSTRSHMDRWDITQCADRHIYRCQARIKSVIDTTKNPISLDLRPLRKLQELIDTRDPVIDSIYGDHMWYYGYMSKVTERGRNKSSDSSGNGRGVGSRNNISGGGGDGTVRKVNRGKELTLNGFRDHMWRDRRNNGSRRRRGNWVD